MPIWAQEIKELERYYESFRGHHPDLEKELERLITTEDENMVLLYSRRCLEVIITDLCETELKRPRKTEPLKGIIDKLNKEEKVPAHIITSMDHLNGLSTYGAHPKEFDPQQVRTVLINLTTILSWYIKYLSVEPDTNSKPIRSVPESVQIKRKNKIFPWKVISLSLIALFIFSIIFLRFFRTESSLKPSPVNKFTFNIPKDENLNGIGGGPAVIFSPDGEKLVYVTIRNDTSRLYLRYMNEFEANPIIGTENGYGPFFSPDSKWLGFFADGNLKKVSIQGGTPQTICKADDNCFEGCWGQDNNIVYTNTLKGIMRVQSSGAIPEQLTSSGKVIDGRLDQFHLSPQLLSGGKVILFTSFNNEEDMLIAAYSPETGKRWNIIGPGFQAQYIPPGYLVYAWKGDLLAIPFNIRMMKVTGQPVVILKGVLMTYSFFLHFSISGNGSLAFIPENIPDKSELKVVSVDLKGKSESLNFPAGNYYGPRFSPDGKNILITRVQEQSSLWIYGLERGTINRFSDNELSAFWGIWSPDCKNIILNTTLPGDTYSNIFRKRSDGSGTMDRLTTNNYFHQLPQCWSADGKYLIYTELVNPKTGFDIWLLPMERDSAPRPFLNSELNEGLPAMSPDGRWLAYVTGNAGQEEVFVCSFPGKENILQISIMGGTEPLWAPDGKEIYYRDRAAKNLMGVSFIAEPELRVGKPAIVFPGNYATTGSLAGRDYDISPDGKRFLMIEYGEEKSTVTQINIVLNWYEELKKLVPAN
jgi:Tol biopolymer transport system component